jgi:hypothetical protein
MSLGVYPALGLADARIKHAELRTSVIAKNTDPLRDKRAGKARTAVPTFGEAADTYIAAHEASWKTAAYCTQWKTTLSTYCPSIRDLPVDQIDTEAVLRVLQPIWDRKPAVASMLRGRIEAVLDAARARGHIDAHRANPARWRGHFDDLLADPKKVRKVVHHAAMPYADVPAFMADPLQRRLGGQGARARHPVRVEAERGLEHDVGRGPIRRRRQALDRARRANEDGRRACRPAL